MPTASDALALAALGILFSITSLVFGSLLRFTTLVIRALISHYLHRFEVKAYSPTIHEEPELRVELKDRFRMPACGWMF